MSSSFQTYDRNKIVTQLRGKQKKLQGVKIQWLVQEYTLSCCQNQQQNSWIPGSQSCAEGYKSPFTSMTGWTNRECIFLMCYSSAVQKKMRKNMGGIQLKNYNFTGCSRDAWISLLLSFKAQTFLHELYGRGALLLEKKWQLQPAKKKPAELSKRLCRWIKL